MQQTLMDCYLNPTKKAFYYSCNGGETGSERLNSMKDPGWDWTPEVSNYVGGASTCMFASAMGCKPLFLEENKEWIEPLITAPEQVKDLDIPDVHQGKTGIVLNNLKEKMRALQPNERIREPDIQSPLGIAELMWDDSFYFAFYEAADALHQLIDKITTFIIRFIKEVKAITGPNLNGAGFPAIWCDERGTMIADDTMSLISPEMHLEFSVPYVNRIADECGPLFYHSCTWKKAYFNNVHQIKNVIAYNWNPGNSDDPREIIDEFSGEAVLAPHLVLEMHRDTDVVKFCREKGLDFKDEFEFFKYIYDGMKDDTAIYFWFSNIIKKKEIIERIYDFLDAEGHSPQARLSVPLNAAPSCRHYSG